jgi:surface antigen
MNPTSREHSFLVWTLLLLPVLSAGCTGAGHGPVDPVEPAASPALQAAPLQASGGYHFTVPEDFNGGIFGGAVGNQLSFDARRDASGAVSGRYNYAQTFGGETFVFKGSVTCFQVYDTPVLQNWPDIPAAVANRAKWGGVIESSNDPTLPPGGFIWFQSIDNGEGAGAPPDLSTLSGFGDEAANEAFCAVANVPNPNFGPHAVEGGNVQVD